MAETVEVPFVKVGNQNVLTDQQLAEDPSLEAFVRRFASCFRRDFVNCFWVYEPAF